MGGGGGGWWYSQRLLSLNPTTVMVVFLLGLWLLLGCDYISKLAAVTTGSGGLIQEEGNKISNLKNRLTDGENSIRNQNILRASRQILDF